MAIKEESVADREMKYLVYRCNGCRRVLTKYQLIAAWDKAEANGADQKGVCFCGSGRVSPTNITTFEELTNLAIWKVWWLDVALPWLRKKLGR